MHFIDYTKPSDKVHHEHLLEVQKIFYIIGKHSKKSGIYTSSKTCIRIENEFVSSKKIKKKYLRKDVVFLPYLFNLYSDVILSILDVLPGFII